MGRGVVGFEVCLAGEDLVEDEMPRRLAVFVKEVEQVVRLAPDLRHQRQRCFAQLVLLAGLGANLGDDGIGAAGNLIVAKAGLVLCCHRRCIACQSAAASAAATARLGDMYDMSLILVMVCR